MSKFIGRRGTLGIAKETARGTAVVPAFWVPRTTLTFDDKVIIARSIEGLGRIEDSNEIYVTQRMGEGSATAELYDKAMGLILASLFGSMPVTTGSNPYTQTYTLSNTNNHQSLTLFYQDPDISEIYPNCVVDSVKFTVNPNGLVVYDIAFKSKVGREWTAQTAVYTSLGAKFLHQHLRFKLAANIAGIAAATALDLKTFSFTIKANTEFDSVLGTVEPLDVLNQQFSVDGEFSLTKEDQTYRNLMLNGTYKSMEIKFDGGASSSLQLQLPRVDFSQWEQDRANDNIVKQKIQFKGNYDAANALAVISTAVLTNTQVSY